MKKFKAWDGDKSKGYKMNGYQYRKAGYHPLSTSRGYVLEHRLIMENHLEKFLPKGSVIHHINGLRDDNRLENLEYIPEQSRHAKHHDNGERNENGQFVAESKEFSNKKFRLYNKDSKQMQILTLQKLISTTFRKSKFEYRGEFTGLTDKNGVEIYEGDIVKCVSGICRVFYMEDSACFALTDTVDDDGWYLYAEHQIYKVIGNIYENPELMEAE